MGDLKLTAADIDARQTLAGGWTRATLAEWGVPWPPPLGWRQALIKHGAPYKPRIAEPAPADEIGVAIGALRTGAATTAQQVRASELLERLANNLRNDAWLCQAYHQLLTEAGIAPGSADLIAAHERLEAGRQAVQQHGEQS